MPSVRRGRPQTLNVSDKTPMTYWTYLTIGFVTFFTITTVSIFENSFKLELDGVDEILRRCKAKQEYGQETEITAIFHGDFPCYFVDATNTDEASYPDSSTFPYVTGSPECLVKAILLASLVLSGHYIVSALLLLLVGLVKSKHVAFVPFLVLKCFVVILLVVLTVNEVGIKEEDGSLVLGKSFYALMMSVHLAAITWFVSLVTCLQVKTVSEALEQERSFDYAKF